MNEPFLERIYWKVIFLLDEEVFPGSWTLPGGPFSQSKVTQEVTMRMKLFDLRGPALLSHKVAPSSCRDSWEASTLKGRPSNREELVEENPAQPARDWDWDWDCDSGWFILLGSDGVEQTEDILWPEPGQLDTDTLESAAEKIWEV